MIRYLRLTNFRRHVDTELRFETTDQIVLVAGHNGVGKSTIFEAVLYALYGEGRNGRANVERLVRKGGELEGMEVELHFELGPDTYQIRRRRDTKLSSALLHANDVPLLEGAREVTAEITRILGMDAKGFRLAAYAQQRELDGLASMRPADRGQMLSRLLRLDVVSRAKEAARAEFRQRRDVLRAIGDGASVADIQTAVADAEREIAGLDAALDAARGQIALFDADIAAGSAIEAAYQAAETQRVRLLALTQAAGAEVQRLRDERASISVPAAVPAPAEPVEQLRRRATEVEQLIARGEQRQRQTQQLRMVRGELDRCDQRLVEIDTEIANAGTVGLVDAATQLERARQTLAIHTEQRGALRERYAETAALLARGREDAAAARALDAECGTCGQRIGDAHREARIAHADAVVARLESDLAEVEVAGKSAREAVEAGTAEVESCVAALAAVERRVEGLARLESERTEIIRRRDVYLAQVDRLVEDDVDLTELYAERAKVTVCIDLANQAREREMLRSAKLEQVARVERSLTEAVERFDAHQAALDASEIATDLQLAYERVRNLHEARSAELDIVAGLQVTAAGATERRNGLARELAKAEELAAKRANIDAEAQVAMWSGQVLERVESTWAQQVRPALEGTVSELVMRLSDGRFDAVAFDAEYNVSVRDRGVLRPIADLSGGEIDLVALAVRLGLSSVVAERHGAGGIGFLILDECFGSQDPSRRISIMSALRGLKSTHGQIFLISHVGGLEDAADAVVSVELDEDAHAVAVRE